MGSSLDYDFGDVISDAEYDSSWNGEEEGLEYPEFDYNLDEIGSEAAFNSSWNEQKETLGPWIWRFDKWNHVP